MRILITNFLIIGIINKIKYTLIRFKTNNTKNLAIQLYNM